MMLVPSPSPAVPEAGSSFVSTTLTVADNPEAGNGSSGDVENALNTEDNVKEV
jgi:hypothetical protein